MRLLNSLTDAVSACGSVIGNPRAVKTLTWRSRPVGWQIEDGKIFELLLPVIELGVEHFALKPVTLPHRVIRVLHGQGFDRGDVLPIENAS